MTFKRTARNFFPLAVLSLGVFACDQSATAPLLGHPQSLLQSTDAIPVRGAETKLPQWSTQPDSILWAHTSKLDTLFVIGLKAPGAKRGIYRGQRLISDLDYSAALHALSAFPKLRITKVDELLPSVRGKIGGPDALRILRRLPFVDYIEPAYLPTDKLYMDSGCDYNQYNNVYDYTPSGDILPRTYMWMRVDRAWAYSTGEGQIIGITDTGVDNMDGGTGLTEFNTPNFTSGQSTGRFIELTSSENLGAQPPCSHGTRFAGVVAAPMNGRNVVGVAWKANLYSVWSANAVWDINGTDQQQAIRMAGNRGAKIVSMAWGVPFFHHSLSDEIDYWYTRDVLFVGAAGTSWADLSQNNVLFPAEKANVLAVSAADWSGERDNQSHYGPELDIIAYHNQPTTGNDYWGNTPVSMEGSSNATAVLTGVAALVRARYPFLTNAQVMNKLVETAGPNCGMPPAFHLLVNAEAAVGGLCVPYPGITGDPGVIFTNDDPVTVNFQISATGGNGQVEYVWFDGQTGPTATYIVYNRHYDYDFDVTVRVRDTGSTNPPLIFSKVIRVDDGVCQPEPPMTECPN